MISAFGVEHGDISKRLSRKEKKNLAVGAGVGGAVAATPSFVLGHEMTRHMWPDENAKPLARVARNLKGGAIFATHPLIGGGPTAAGALIGAGVGGAYIGAKRWKKNRSTR